MPENKKLFTKEAYQDLVDDLEYLKTVRSREVAEKLKEARSFGDLSENAEYDAAKDEQAALESEIKEKEYQLSIAVIVNESDINENEVNLGSRVVLKDRSDGSLETYIIDSSSKSDPENGIISDESPVGKAAMHSKVGDVFDVNTPMGIVEFEVMEVSRETKGRK